MDGSQEHPGYTETGFEVDEQTFLTENGIVDL